MQFEFHAHPTGGLRIIPTVEDFPLCWIEGRNGIGKTVAFRLLELATGEQPYASNPAAWSALRQNLGAVHIKVSGLRGVHSLELLMDSREWPLDPVQQPHLVVARKDGEIIDLEEVRALLRVFRVGGDESIVARFRATLLARKGLVVRQNKWLDTRIDELHLLADDLLRDIPSVSLEDWVNLEHQIAEESTRRTDTEEALSRIQHEIELIEELETLRNALHRISQEGPQIDQRLREIENNISNNDAERQALQESQSKLQPAAAAARELTKRLNVLNEERIMETEAALDSRARADTAAKALNVDSDHPQLNDLRRDVERKRKRLINYRATLIPAQDLIDVIQHTRAPLAEVEGSSLDDAVVATFDTRQVVAYELRVGLDTRLEEIRLGSEAEELAKVDQELQDLDQQLVKVREAKLLLQRANRIANKLDETEAAIAYNLRMLNSGNEEEYQAVTRELQDREEKRNSLIEQRARLRMSKQFLEAEGAEPFLQQRIAALQDDVGIVESSIDALSERRERADVLKSGIHSADERLLELHQKFEETESRISRSVALLEGSSGYAWLRDAIDDAVPSKRQDTQSAIMHLERLEQALTQLIELLDGLSNRTAALEDAMSDLADRVGGHPSSENVYMRSLASSHEEEFGELLSDSEIQSALFGSGQFKALDLLRGEVSWIESGGETYRRPLEAFSSGELAFAYVLASILQHRDVSAQNRVLVLDEFGAFVEADRLDRLRHFLHDRVLNSKLAEQVVIVMPLRKPIQVAGRKPISQLEEEVERRGYFCQGIPL